MQLWQRLHYALTLLLAQLAYPLLTNLPTYLQTDRPIYQLTHTRVCERERKDQHTHTHKRKEIKLKKLEPSARNASRNFCDSVQGFVNSLSSMLNNKRGGGVGEDLSGREGKKGRGRQGVAEVASDSGIYDMSI